MIKVKVNTPKPINPPRTFTLELSEGAALAIVVLCGNVLGDNETSLRKHSDQIYEALSPFFSEGGEYWTKISRYIEQNNSNTILKILDGKDKKYLED